MEATGILPGIAVSLLPVVAFLLVLQALDSFKLVNYRTLLWVVAAGAVTAGASYFLNTLGVRWLDLGPDALRRYYAPFVEEMLKAVIVVYVVRSDRSGFLVDSAILGFAVGTGFALLENIYYLGSAVSPSIFTWIVRGFGTAIMHGGATALYAIVTKTLDDRAGPALWPLLPGLLVAFAVHSFFNHLVVPPIVSTAVLLVTLPLLMMIVFQQSERYTRDWLGVGFDSDQELLDLIRGGNISETRIGAYLQSLRDHFAGEVIADMLCWLRIQVELSIKAKGVMLMREAGFKPQPDQTTRAKLEELAYLEESIGKIGILAVSPLVRASRRDAWQLQLLDGN